LDDPRGGSPVTLFPIEPSRHQEVTADATESIKAYMMRGMNERHKAIQSGRPPLLNRNYARSKQLFRLAQ
jgi:hypothetical protein